MITFYPEVFWYITPLLVLLIPALFQYRKGKAILITLGGEWRKDKIVKIYFIKSIIYWITLMLFFVFSLISVAGFSWTRESVRDESEGLDIVYAVDISRSMLTRDILPDRLTRARELIISLSSNLPHGREGLVIFKGKGHILVPLTDDRIVLESAVTSLSPSLYTVAGSNIALGLKSAIEAFPQGSPARKAIVLITDGESLEGNPVSMAREIFLKDISLFIAGAGTPQGGLIYDSSGEVITDSTGQTVVSRMKEEILQNMAVGGSGRYYNLSDIKTQGLMIQDLMSLTEESGAEGIRFRDQMNYRVFLLAALFFLLLNLISTHLRWSRWY